MTQAMPQNSCPTVEIRITALAAAELSARLEIASAGYAGLQDRRLLALLAAKVSASSTIQPTTAE